MMTGFTIRSMNYTSLDFSKLTKNLHPHENLHMDAYSRFILSCPNLKESWLH